MRNLAWLTALAAALFLGACATDEVAGPEAAENENGLRPAPAGEGETIFARNGEEPTLNLVETAIAAEFNTLVAAVTQAELVDTLAEGGPFTVFAPTDQAFADLPDGLVDALLLDENKDKLVELLTYHVVAGAVESSDLRFYQKVPTLQGDELRILRFFSLVKVNDARVELADVLATNGVIHVINKVLIPEGFSLEDSEKPEDDIVDTAIAGNFDTLVAAVIQAELVDALRADGPFTVFAPSEEAFAALPDGLLNELLLDENKDKLTELLLYHVADGRVLSTDLRRFQFVKMKNSGYTFVQRRWNGDVRVNRSGVDAADVLASNGVIHVINKVLIPYSFYGKFQSLPQEAPSDHPALQPVPEGASR